jgi:Malate synthase
VPCTRVESQVHTCHKRGAHAMGGMAAQIPVKNNPALQEEAMGKVKEDKVLYYTLLCTDRVYVQLYEKRIIVYIMRTSRMG